MGGARAGKSGRKRVGLMRNWGECGGGNQRDGKMDEATLDVGKGGLKAPGCQREICRLEPPPFKRF